MQVISLFSGIGGFELAAEWMGWENIVSCEINPFGQRVLKHYWPNAYHHDDVHTLTYTRINDELTKRKGADWRTDDIVLVGGFPCQPYSQAGKRLGKDDERHLWPEMLRIISEVKPTYIVGENVYGLVNWSEGLVFEEVCADLEGQGYEVQPVLLPAASIGAPHKRDRVWFVAYAKNNGWNGRECKQRQGIEINQRNICQYQTKGWDEIWPKSERYRIKGPTPDTDKPGREERHDSGEPAHTKTDGARLDDRTQRLGNDGPTPDTRQRFIKPNWDNFPTVSPIRSRNDGLSDRLDGITFYKWRNESIKAAGNAIVPQVVYQIFKCLEAMK